MTRDHLGAHFLEDGRCAFLVWAPAAAEVSVHLADGSRTLRLERESSGYHRGAFTGVPRDARYRYRLDGGPPRADPASRFQPEGVHGPSQVVDIAFEWTDGAWRGIARESYVFYELHTGTFSRAGTFDGVVPELERLRALGVTAIELMPVAQFPGGRNWGYDGVLPFAAQSTYGGPRGLQRLVDACHRAGLAVVLDVVYNHLGPEGNHLGEFGPYFTDVYQTPWGRALNFDGPDSDEVRRYFIENALQWIEDFHVDALRLDAVHAILDRSSYPFLEELADRVRASAARLGRQVHLVAESDSNDPRLVQPARAGGLGLDSMWCDDLHHALHVQLTGETAGYYVDYEGLEHLARAWERGLSYTGEFSHERRRRHGRPNARFGRGEVVVCAQNHDQVGNRMLGERLSTLVEFEAQKLAAAVVLLSPHTPLLFMGEEYGETAPFQYFVSHGDPELIENVRRGRKKEFASFGWTGEPPDPQSEETFAVCKLDPALRGVGRHAVLYRLHGELLALRREIARNQPDIARCLGEERVLTIERTETAWMIFHFGAEPRPLSLPVPAGSWRKRIASADAAWQGSGADGTPRALAGGANATLLLAPRSFVVYTNDAAGVSSRAEGA